MFHRISGIEFVFAFYDHTHTLPYSYMYKQADAALCLWIVIPNFVVNPKAKSSLRAGDDNNNKYKDNNEHFVNPVFMRNYVFFALVSQAVTETRRDELS